MKETISEAVLESARGLHRAGVMSDERLREFDAMCKRPPSAYSPAQIRRIRAKTKSSLDMFAICLNTSKATVRRWESGEVKPCGPSLKLLNLVERKGLDALVDFSVSAS